MSEYTVTKKIDYIQCSVTSFMTADDTFGKWQDARPLHRNYNRAKEFEIGVFVQWHDERTNMKINIILNGTTLANMRSVGFTDYDILHWLKSMPDCKFSRIDVAVTSTRNDGKIHGFLPHAVNYLAENGLCETKLKVDNPVATPDLTVETAYIGSRKSRNRLFRAYDKGIEIGSQANRIIRYELETRKNATHIADDMYVNRTDIGAIIRRYIDFPQHEVWCEVMDSDPAPNYRIDDERPQHVIDREQQANRENWLLTSVAPAMATLAHSYENGFDNDFWDKFSQMVAYHYNAKVDSDIK